MSMSPAFPFRPGVHGWWIMTTELGSAKRLAWAPAQRRRDAPLAAIPRQTVPTAGRTYCMAS